MAVQVWRGRSVCERMNGWEIWKRTQRNEKREKEMIEVQFSAWRCRSLIYVQTKRMNWTVKQHILWSFVHCVRLAFIFIGQVHDFHYLSPPPAPLFLSLSSPLYNNCLSSDASFLVDLIFRDIYAHSSRGSNNNSHCDVLFNFIDTRIN